MAKKSVSISALVESHRPKYFKHAIIPTEEAHQKLEEENFDFKKLDTINNEELLEHAIHADYHEYDRTIIKKAKEPTCLDDGIIISKKMVTKADQKLQSVGIGRFVMDNTEYVSIRLRYEYFDIFEIFILN